MGEIFDPMLFDEALTPERRRVLDEALAADPALAEALARWQALRAALRHSLDAHLPDRHLLVLYALAARADTLSPAERQALDAARDSLERALATHPALHDVVRQIQADAEAFEATWQAHFATPSRAADRAPRRQARQRIRRWVWRLGGAATLVAFGVILTLVFQRDHGLVTVATAPGEVRVVTLADGSTARLMGGAQLSFLDPAQGFNRRARLVGRAYFDIVPDRQPFTVETPTALTTVLGTRFSVQSDAGRTEVVLVTGRVTLASRDDRAGFVVLEPGQMSLVIAGALPAPPTPVDVTEALAWTGLFIFRATPLADIAERLAGAYGVPVTVAPTLAAEPISGTFEQAQPLEEILQALAATLSAEVLPEGDGFRLAPRDAG